MEVPKIMPGTDAGDKSGPDEELDIRGNAAEQDGQKINKNTRREYFLDTIHVSNPAKRDKEHCRSKKKDIGNPAQGCGISRKLATNGGECHDKGRYHERCKR